MHSLVLWPEPMTRIAVVAPKAAQGQVIEALHGCQLAHIEEFVRGDNAQLDIGSPLAGASRGSELLVRLRALTHALELSPEAGAMLSRQDVRLRIEAELPRIETHVRQAHEEKERSERELEQLRDRRALLAPLQDLPLRLEDYSGYTTIRVLAGLAPRDLSSELASVLRHFEYFASDGAHAIFVKARELAAAQTVLTREGFREIEIPKGAGSIPDELGRMAKEEQALEGRLTGARERLATLAKAEGDFVRAAEEDLSIEVEKAEAPLNFGSTERAVFVDAWVPSADVDRVKSAVDEAAGGRVHFEVLDAGSRRAHERAQAPPTKYKHPPGVRRFGPILDILSPPQYGEVDPTIVLFLVFPFFFGFMIGDLGYGILMTALGLLLYRRVGRKSETAKAFGFALFLAGLWATLFGAVVFHDALGIPFAPHGAHDEDGLSWEGLLGLHFGLGEPILEKLGDEGVKEMLALSILAAFVHLFVAFLFGFVNEMHHSRKHAVGKLGWMLVLTCFFLVALVMGPPNRVSDSVMHFLGDPTMTTAIVFAVPGLLVLIVTEGALGLMEVLGLLSNLISYTRLAGVAVAKGAMAGAFNFIFLQGMVLEGTNWAVLAIGFTLFVVAQLIVFVLGLISSGIQSIRLNWVEFFLKFYKGGGRPFAPFGRVRQYTTPAANTTI